MSFISFYLSYVKLYFTLQITKVKPIEIMMIFSKSLRIKNSNSILKFVITRSFAIAFSKQRICGWIATRETFTADKMKDFYYELFYSKIKIFKEDNELPFLCVITQ